ncbi:MAG: BamA/TamA family outer membrane protein [Leptolyngbyaceae cyanobacterium]
MRQTPSLVALLTLSATLGLASQARGETLASPSKEANISTVSVAEILDTAETSTRTLATESVQRDRGLSTLQYFDESSLSDDAEPNQATEASTNLERVPMPGIGLTEQKPFAGVSQLSQQPDEPNETTEERTQVDMDPDSVDPVDDDEAVTNEVDEPPEAAEDIESEDAGADTPEAAPETTTEENGETQVLVAEVAVADPEGNNIDPELENEVYGAIDTRPGQTTTRSQIQEDINNVFATGFFANVRAVPTDTPLGVRVTFVVDPNPVLTQVKIEGSDVLPDEVVNDIFSPQYGEIINLLDFQDGILELNNWYQDNGYVLAQVIAAPSVGEDGVVTLQVAEGVIEDINVQFMTEEGLTEDEEGNPIDGKTQDYIVLREFETEPGDVFQQAQIQSDLQQVFGLGIFDDVNLTLNPGDKDPRKVDVTVNVIERNTGSVAAGVGFNFTGDLFGTLSYRQDNFGGNNQKFAAEAQLSFRDILFDVSFTDPWIGGDPYMTSYTLNGFGRRSISLVFDGGPNEIDLPNGDRVRVNRFGGGVTFRRPDVNILGSTWDASLGTLYQRVRTTDADGSTVTEDAAGNPLTASDSGSDDLWTVQFGLVQDSRNDPFSPTSGSVIRLGTEQSIPLGNGSIFFNRVRASYSYYIPVSLFNFSEGPQALAINVQGGSILGDFPPYEAFAIGGTNSVRGYDEGELGTGQSYLQASVEYRFPLFSFLGGALFLDAGTDVGTGDSVPGSPGPDRGKPGSGYGFGAGVRVQTPLGPIRVDYGINDEGDGRLHFGIGERF